jgi:V/A-type H+-transporting ATPase subunit F
MSEIAMVGDRDSILGFKALGVSIFPAETIDEVIGILRTLIQQEFKIAFITEQVAPDAETITNEMKGHESLSGKTMPVIMMIPSNKGSMGLGMQRMQELVRKAAGADIWGRKD